jgi:hypothetical protein
MVAEEVFVSCYNFNPVTKVKKGNFQCTLYNYPKPGPGPEPEPKLAPEPEPKLEPEPKFGFAALC